MIIEPAPCDLCTTRDASEGYRGCSRCRLELRDALDDVVRLAATLDGPDALLQRRTSGGRGAPGYRSTSPANDTVIAFTDKRTVALRAGDPWDVVGVLGGWADQVREMTGLKSRPRPRCITALRMRPRTLTSEIGVLFRMLDWITRQDWCEGFAREVIGIRDALSDLTGDRQARVRIGRCPTPVHDQDTGQDVECRYLLQARPGDKNIHCPRCDTTWPRLYWPDLGAALKEGPTA